MLNLNQTYELQCILHSVSKEILDNKSFGIKCNEDLLSNYNIINSLLWLSNSCCDDINYPTSIAKNIISKYSPELNKQECIECNIVLTEIDNSITCSTIIITEL